MAKIKTWYAKIIILFILFAGGYWGYRQLAVPSAEVTYQTSTVIKGTLITSISATGTISSGNTTNISTKASGTVSRVYVQNGDIVKKGQKLLDIALDEDGIERRSTAWKAYLLAEEAAATAVKEKNEVVIQVWKDKQAILDAETVWEEAKSNTELTDSERHQKEEEVTQAKLAFDVNAEKQANADDKIGAAKISQQKAYRDYLDVSGSITAPTAGIINNLTLTAGSTLTASTSQSTSTGSSYASSQTIGFIRAANNQYLASVSLTEVDVTKVKAGQVVTLTMDAHEGKTFTGKVLAVDVSGSSSSGVTSYPATIQMDATELPIYPNMSVSATITTNTVTDALLVPSNSITTDAEGTSTVTVMKEGKQQVVAVETGSSNDTQTVVVSGLSEGEQIVTGVNSAKNDNTSSAFDSNNSGNAVFKSGGGARETVIMGGPGF